MGLDGSYTCRRARPACARPLRDAHGSGEGGGRRDPALGQDDEYRPDAHARQGARADPAALGVLGSGGAARPWLGAAGPLGAGSAGSGQVVPRRRLAMKFYEAVLSSAAFRVRIALGLKGLAYESMVFDLRAKEHLTDDYRRVNPMRSVPALELAPGQALFESMAIVEYLDETHPEPPLLPKDPLARARVRAIAQLVACDIHPPNNLRVLRYLSRELKADDAG